MMHSSLMHLGRLDAHVNDDHAKAIIETIQAVLGAQGTLCVPAAFYDYGKKKQPFDVARSPVSRLLGVLSRYVQAMPGAQRSLNPIFSVAAVGPLAEDVCGGIHGSAFGPGSAWECLFRMNADVLYFGCDLSHSTLLRYVESVFGVPYLYNKLFDTQVIKNGRAMDVSICAPLRFQYCPAIYDPVKFKAFEGRLRDRGVLRECHLGGGKIMAIAMKDFYAEAVTVLSGDLYYFLQRVPDYVPGQVPVA